MRRVNLPNNHLRFPNNIFPPMDIEMKTKPDGTLVEETPRKYKLFIARFNNLYELYDYLKSNPRINSYVFETLESESDNTSYSGKPYKEAVEDLIKDEEHEYDEFLKLQKSINNAVKVDAHEYKKVKAVTGGQLNIPAYTVGDPMCYDSKMRIKKPKFIKMHVLISYNARTTKNQVLNRAIIVANLVKALENAGYNIDLETFELSYLENEIEYTGVKIKNHGQKMKMSNLYKVLCHIEFFRRLLFRVLETLDFENYWSSGYGYKCSKEFTYELLKIGKNDIFIDQPIKMGIKGRDLAEDFESMINYLNLQDKIDVEKAKDDFTKEAEKLKLKR
ncbi:MAG: hypothetical protein IKR57_04335 [Bacilli bacterium]|nr:hypothetical protein [Bacilli bacterium]